MRILVVDDHQVVRRGVCSLLERQEGLEVCGEAVDGRDAIAKARELRPDAIVMDISMPVMNGLEATREITRQFPRIRVVILSQHASQEMMQEAQKAGAHGYVIKSEASQNLTAALYSASQSERANSVAEPAASEPSVDVQAILQRSAGFEKALRESEERLRSLVEYQSAVMGSMAEGMYTVDAKGALTFLNPAGEALLGWTMEELLGKKMHDATHYRYPDGTPFPGEHCAGLHVLMTGVPIREHADTFIRKDGHFLPVVFSASPLKRNGQTAGVVVAFRDNTEQRRSREALLRAHHELETATAQLRLVTDTMAIGVNRCTSDLRYIWANESYAAWLQRKPHEIIGRPIEDVIGKEAFERLLPHFQAVLQGREIRYEEEADFAGLGRRWISAVYTPTRNSNGVADGWVAVVRDVTARKHGQEAARRDRELLEAEAKALARLHELTSRLMLATDLKSGLNEVLASAIELMGAAMGNVQLLDADAGVLRIVGQHGFRQKFLDFFREISVFDNSACGRTLRSRAHVSIPDIEADAEYARYRAVALEAGYRAVLSVPLLSTKESLLGVLSVHFAAPYEPSEHAIGWLNLYAQHAASFIERWQTDEVIRQSETELRQYREELEKLVTKRTAELTEANRQLSKFSARVLQMQDAERRRLARELHDSAGQIITAVDLNASSIEAQLDGQNPELKNLLGETRDLIGRLSQEIRTTSYLLHPPLLDHVGLPLALREYVKELAERSGLKIEVEASEDFGRLAADKELALFRLVQEALTNVLRHSGSASATIRLSRNGDRVELQVEDAGRGMPPAVLAKVQQQGGGVGIGGMRERVRDLGGDLKIDSCASGTKVSATIPAGVTEDMMDAPLA